MIDPLANRFTARNSMTSKVNSTTVPLASGATFTGGGEQNDYPCVGVMLKTDQDGTLYFDFSNDGTNWDSTFPVAGFGVAAGVSEFHTAVKLGRYFRCRMVNGTDGAQTYLRLKTYYGVNFLPISSPLNQSLSVDSDSVAVRTDNFTDEVLRGLRGGVSHFTKFGYNQDVDSAAAEVVAAFGGSFTPMTSAQTFSIAFNDTNDGADAGATGAKTLYIQYIDANGLDAEATHTLTDTSPDTTSFTGLGINRVSVSSSGSSDSNVNDITFTSSSGGTNQALIPAGDSVTQQCIFFVDSNSFAIIRNIWINVNKITGGGGSSPRVTLRALVYNRNVATTFEVFRATVDTDVDNFLDYQDRVGFRLSPTDVFYLTAETSANNTIVNARFSLLEYKQN